MYVSPGWSHPQRVRVCGCGRLRACVRLRVPSHVRAPSQPCCLLAADRVYPGRQRGWGSHGRFSVPVANKKTQPPFSFSLHRTQAMYAIRGHREVTTEPSKQTNSQACTLPMLQTPTAKRTCKRAGSTRVAHASRTHATEPTIPCAASACSASVDRNDGVASGTRPSLSAIDCVCGESFSLDSAALAFASALTLPAITWTQTHQRGRRCT